MVLESFALPLSTFLSRLLRYCAGDIGNHFVLFEIVVKFFLVAICLDFLFKYSLVDSMSSLISVLLVMFYLMIKLCGNLLTPSMLEDLGYEMYLLSYEQISFIKFEHSRKGSHHHLHN
jgi:hypothetical protein